MSGFESKLKGFFSIDDPTLLVAFLSALGYCSAYIFEYGYLAYFDVPSSFIQIDLITTIKATAVIVFSFYLFLSFFGLALDLSKKAHPFWQLIGNGLIFILFMVPFIYANVWTDIRHLWFLLGLFIFFILANLLPPLFNKNFQTYWSRVSNGDIYKSESNDAVSNSKSFFSYFMFIGVSSFLVISIIFGLGMRHAKNESLFWTLEYQPDMIIVRLYGDTIIAKRVNLATHETIEGVEIFKIDSNSTLIIKSKINFILSKVEKDHRVKVKDAYSLNKKS